MCLAGLCPPAGHVAVFQKFSLFPGTERQVNMYASMTQKLSWTASSLLVLAIFSCGPDAFKTQPESKTAQMAPAARHAVHSDQLQTIMDELGESTNEDWPQEMADLRAEQDQQARFREAQQLARTLTQSAKQIPGAVADTPMTEKQRTEFLAGVDELEQKAAQLEAAAAAQDIRRMQSALGKIKMTCCGCHSQFCEKPKQVKFSK